MGWGTVAVGAAAIVMSSIFNYLTLKRSAKTLTLAERSYQRTEERYRADRVEAHKDKLRTAIIEVAHQVTVWEHIGSYYATMLKVHAADVEQTAPGVKLMADRAKIPNYDIDRQRPALNDILRAVRTAMLLADSATRALVVKIDVTLQDVTPTVNRLDYEDPELMINVAARLDEIRADVSSQVTELFTHVGRTLAYKDLET